MRKLFGCLLALALALTLAAAAGAESAEKVTGNIEDGAYVLTVTLDPEEAGEWRADEMAQDDTVVKLAASGIKGDVFTARYEPAGDGEVTVTLRHFNEHACDEMHTFDLLVKDGQVQEVTGGSYTASPHEMDLDGVFSGEWLEKDTQFTTLDVTKKVGDGWDIGITSPVSHGAWIIRATVYYDCDYDAFVYADGVKYDLIPGKETLEKEAETELWGTLKFTEAEEGALQLEWYDMKTMNGETLAFVPAPALPAYTYTGEDPIEGAVADALAKDTRAQDYLTEMGYVTIPCPIIHKTEMTDETHATVYGSFWILNYAKHGTVLECISGGEYPGIMTLEQADGVWRVTGFEEAGDGEDYTADILRFANGDAELAEQYFAAADLGAEANQAIRTRFIQAYVDANSLPVTAYRDYGWDPVELK